MKEEDNNKYLIIEIKMTRKSWQKERKKLLKSSLVWRAPFWTQTLILEHLWLFQNIDIWYDIYLKTSVTVSIQFFSKPFA